LGSGVYQKLKAEAYLKLLAAAFLHHEVRRNPGGTQTLNMVLIRTTRSGYSRFKRYTIARFHS